MMKMIKNEIHKLRRLLIMFVGFDFILCALTITGLYNSPNPVWPERAYMYLMFCFDAASYFASVFLISQLVYFKIKLNKTQKERLVAEILQI